MIISLFTFGDKIKHSENFYKKCPMSIRFSNAIRFIYLFIYLLIYFAKTNIYNKKIQVISLNKNMFAGGL